MVAQWRLDGAGRSSACSAESGARRSLRGEVVAAGGGVADAILGFHAQQAVEKSLKAVLASADVQFPYTTTWAA